MDRCLAAVGLPEVGLDGLHDQLDQCLGAICFGGQLLLLRAAAAGAATAEQALPATSTTTATGTAGLGVVAGDVEVRGDP